MSSGIEYLSGAYGEDAAHGFTARGACIKNRLPLTIAVILSRPEILKAISEGRIEISPFDTDQVGPCSVDLALGNEFRRFRPNKETLAVGERVNEADFSERVKVRKNERLTLAPGELVLGVTQERLKLSDDLCARLDGRSRFARMGLLVHVSASLIQPGVHNVQVLEMMNLAPYRLALKPGLRVCQVVFEELKGRARYQGAFKTQSGVEWVTSAYA
jgi:dCTP deaminase